MRTRAVTWPLLSFVVAALLFVSPKAFAGGTGICVTPDGRNVPCSSGSSSGGYSGGDYRGVDTAVNLGINFMNQVISGYQQEQQRVANEATAANNKGTSYYNRGDFEAAIMFYEQAHQINPSDHQIRDNLNLAKARRLIKIGDDYKYDDPDTAIRYYEQALAIFIVGFDFFGEAFPHGFEVI